MTSKWSYLSRTLKDISSSLLPLEHSIRTKLIPALTGRPPPNNTERELLALPARQEGITLADPNRATDVEFLASTKITEALQAAILNQDFEYSSETVANQLEAKKGSSQIETGASH